MSYVELEFGATEGIPGPIGNTTRLLGLQVRTTRFYSNERIILRNNKCQLLVQIMVALIVNIAKYSSQNFKDGITPYLYC
jgi:hypothetical protein